MGPHSGFEYADARQRFAAALFDRLWARYRDRVQYVQTYERVIAEAGATFFNDHIAFRSIAWQEPFVGIATTARIFESLGYRPAGAYSFPDKKLSAVHFDPPDPRLPKLFFSELRAVEFSRPVRRLLAEVLKTHRAPPTREFLASLASLTEAADEQEVAGLMDHAYGWLTDLPWETPQRAIVEAANEHSQYAAWVLLHGYNVNHFTSLINSHGVETLDDIEKTADALAAAGVPMKSQIEGEPGAMLRQTATEAVTIDVSARDEEAAITMPWTYAYFELAERPPLTDASGATTRYEGFLGSQATKLFEMTKRN
jgi:hypothetical protein